MTTFLPSLLLLLAALNLTCSGNSSPHQKSADRTAHQEAKADFALHHIVKQPASPNTGKRKAIVLLHGYGSNEQDLFSLSSQLPRHFMIISARAPHTLSEGSYAWFKVDFSGEEPVGDAKQAESSRLMIREFLSQVKKHYKLDEVYLGGFSQGAIMSLATGLIDPAEVKGLICLSGRMPDEIKPLVKKSRDIDELDIFLAHGTQDNVLGVHHARAAKQYLDSLGGELTYHEFAIAHTIDAQVLHQLNLWLQQQEKK